MADQNLTVDEGAYVEIPFAAVDGDGAAVDLSGVALTYRVAHTASSATLIEKTSADGITLEDAPGGLGLITLANDETADLGSGLFGTRAYYHELSVVDGSGHQLIGFRGALTVQASQAF